MACGIVERGAEQGLGCGQRTMHFALPGMPGHHTHWKWLQERSRGPSKLAGQRRTTTFGTASAADAVASSSDIPPLCSTFTFFLRCSDVQRLQSCSRHRRGG